MSDLLWPLMAIAAAELARTADNEPGRFALGAASCFFLTCALLVAPWSNVFGVAA